ncbi:elongation factor Ts [Candidatus Bipolaricaulota bacterium]|nr:elongation factor Ts [Candidatus Bipolaricaulota bacterium]
MIKNEDIKKLRAKTGVGIMDCKNALIKAEGDMEKAKQILREEGRELLAHKGREATEGRIEAYVHHSGKIGVLLEVACNTDFVANSDDFRQFTRELAMHIAAARARYISPEDVPETDLETEKGIYRKQGEKEGKPPQILEKIVEGRLQKFYTEVCLLKQPFVKDSTHTIEDLLADLRSKTGENIFIKRFARYEIGEEA